MQIGTSKKFSLSVASECDREKIYNIRNEVYAKELKQHALSPTNELRDDLDHTNHYIVAKHDDEVKGFVSITSPQSPKYSVDKYFPRTSIPYAFDDELYEIRLLTITEKSRKSSVALALMYAAFRWIQSHGGKHIVSICRSDILGMYLKAGLNPLHVKTVSGAVHYDLCVGEIDHLEKGVQLNKPLYTALKSKVTWNLPFAFFAPSACYHGGDFFEAIGEDLQQLQKANEIINADVLDAWFPPSPKVLNILHDNLPWLLQTSPPTHSKGFIKVISEVRGINENCILPGAGSSDLIFLSFKNLLHEKSKVLIIDPCYGEYVHVLEKIIQCQVTRFTLNREDGFVVDCSLLLTEMQKGYDMVVLVNPNSPTGIHIPKIELVKMLSLVPQQTLVWIDETYIEYAGAAESLEDFATKRENVIVCKSMSKVYALSGVRAGYLCCSPHLIETLKTLMPPWAVSLPAQAAAITALKDDKYYRARHEETHVLRDELKQRILNLGVTEVIDGVANFLLFYLPQQIKKHEFLDACKAENLFLRDVSNMGNSLGKNAIRIAVKDEPTNDQMVGIIQRAMSKQSITA